MIQSNFIVNGNIDYNDDYQLLILQDLNQGKKSVTNDIEEIAKAYKKPNKKIAILYKDSENRYSAYLEKFLPINETDFSVAFDKIQEYLEK